MCGTAIVTEPEKPGHVSAGLGDDDEFAPTVALPAEFAHRREREDAAVAKDTEAADSEWLLPQPPRWRRHAGQAAMAAGAIAALAITWTVARATVDAPTDQVASASAPGVSDVNDGSDASDVSAASPGAPDQTRPLQSVAPTAVFVQGRSTRSVDKRSRRSRRAARRSASRRTAANAPAANAPAAVSASGAPETTGGADPQAGIDAAVAALTGDDPGLLANPSADAKPVAEPVAEPAAEPAAEPTAEPVAEPAAEPVAEPAAEPASEPAAEPVAEPDAEPVAEPDAEPVAEPTAEPVAEPADESAADVNSEPESDSQPAPEPAPEPEESEEVKRARFFVKLGNTQLDQGNKAGAGASFARALSLDPDSEDAKAGLKRARADAP